MQRIESGETSRLSGGEPGRRRRPPSSPRSSAAGCSAHRRLAHQHRPLRPAQVLAQSSHCEGREAEQQPTAVAPSLVFRCRFHWGFYYRLFQRLCQHPLLGLWVVRFRSFLGCELFFQMLFFKCVFYLFSSQNIFRAVVFSRNST